ncbi:MAG: hypothetical protein H7Y43_08165, partial [Akkermansiaceae bacterium]|nr:hypothetical protein [Verrucomicrobiales bacterium]
MKLPSPLLVISVGFVLVSAVVLWRMERPAWISLSVKSASPAVQEQESRQPTDPQHLVGKPSARPEIEITLATIEAEQDPMRREEWMQLLAATTSDADLATAIAALQNGIHTELSTDLQLRLLRRWAGIDPAAAAGWTTRELSGEVRQEALGNIAIEWASRNLEKAIDWAKQLPAIDDQQNALLSTAYEAARTTPRQALALAVELLECPARDEAITHAATQWATVQPTEAAAWAIQITDESLREQVLAAIAIAWGDRDPVQAANLAVQSLSPGRLQDDAIISVVQHWVQTQPEAAAAWV